MANFLTYRMDRFVSELTFETQAGLRKRVQRPRFRSPSRSDLIVQILAIKAVDTEITNHQRGNWEDSLQANWVGTAMTSKSHRDPDAGPSIVGSLVLLEDSKSSPKSRGVTTRLFGLENVLSI